MIDSKKMKIVHEMREQKISWEEIEMTIEGFTDYDRKLYAGWLLAKEDDDDESQLIKYAKSLQHIRKMRKLLAFERSYNNEQIKQLAMQEKMLETFKQKMNEILPKKNTIKSKPKSTKNTHIITISDFHYDGNKTLLENFDIIENKIINEIETFDIKHLHLIEMGDLIEGATLRTSQLLDIEKGMISQFVDVSARYVQLLQTLMNHTHLTFMILESSNHTQIRNLGTKQNEISSEDIMRLFSNHMKVALPILEIISGESITTEIDGFVFHFEHGHLIRGKSGYLEKKQSNMNRLIDYAFFGHFHHEKQQDLHMVNNKYDRKVFYVPTANNKLGGFEKDRNLSSHAGIGHYIFEKEDGHVMSKKILLK
jgi:hypothetical protein